MALRKLTKVILTQSNRAACLYGARCISGKALREADSKLLKPFPYEEQDFRGYNSLEKTSYRFDENSKLIVVDGAHAIGKSKFAQELAEDLDMKFISYPRVTDMLINGYGVDLRQYNDLMLPINKTYDEIDFSRNPVGPVEGCGDRFCLEIYKQKWKQHIHALRHILNTGQGVVMEGCPFNDYAYFDAAYNQGWIARESRVQYKEVCRVTLPHIMKPNLYIYLDAPVDTVVKNIQNRGNEWDKDSPVWTNKQYLLDIYNELKRNFLKQQQQHSRVLVYDWTEPGDMEIVVEDIEALNFDLLEETDTQQSDWRFQKEELLTIQRMKYCNFELRNRLLNQVANTKPNYSCVNFWREPDEQEHLEDVLSWIKSERYAYGFNSAMGDKNIMFRGFPLDESCWYQIEHQQKYWHTTRESRRRFWGDDNDFEGI